MNNHPFSPSPANRYDFDRYEADPPEGPQARPNSIAQPTIILLQGTDLPRSEYSALACSLSFRGINVIVPDLKPPGANYICPTHATATAFIQYIRPSLSPASPLWLFGHSAGGIAAFQCASDPAISPHIQGVIVFASNALSSSQQSRLNTVLFLCGEADTIVPPNLSKKAYESMTPSLKALVEVPNYHHYSITSSGLPTSLLTESHDPHPYGTAATQLIADLSLRFMEKSTSPQDLKEHLTQTPGLINSCIDIRVSRAE